uniref:Uncharacterized protein n=1 Tax=Anguilla anguilla TaxID=7936 RepID=A0A0E9XHA7_ANGAN
MFILPLYICNVCVGKGEILYLHVNVVFVCESFEYLRHLKIASLGLFCHYVCFNLLECTLFAYGKRIFFYVIVQNATKLDFCFNEKKIVFL